MARVQQSANKQTQKTNQNKPSVKKQNQQAPKSKLELAKTQSKREPSKNEILLFRAGMTIIGLTLLTLAIIFTVRYYMNRDENLNPFEEYFHVTVKELEIFATFIQDTGTYGDLSEFDGKPEYADLRAKIQNEDVIYFFFYRASDINSDVKAAIDAIENIKDKPILFINMDDLINNNTLFSSQILAHLNLNETRSHMFLIYDIYAQDQFELWTANNIIILELAKL
jgi:hypothetical protein